MRAHAKKYGDSGPTIIRVAAGFPTGVEPRMPYRASIEQLMLNHIPAGQRECQHREKK
jgi:hypothetical protein